MNSIKHKIMKYMTNEQRTLLLLKIPYINLFKLENTYIKNIKLIGGDPNEIIKYEKEYNKKYDKDTGKFYININNNKYYYRVERYSSGENESNEDKQYKFIDLITIKDKYKNYIDCGSIAIDTINNIATITSLGSNIKCLKSKNNVEFKYGDILFQIMLYLCKKEKIIKIELTDNSYRQCGNITLSLNYLKTLTHGIPHYYKYGFKYKYDKDNKILKENHKHFITDPKMKKNDLILLIKEKKIDDNVIKQLIKILGSDKTDKVSIKRFVKMITLDLNNIEYCNLIEKIYIDLLEIAGYITYYTKDFELYLYY